MYLNKFDGFKRNKNKLEDYIFADFEYYKTPHVLSKTFKLIWKNMNHKLLEILGEW